MAASPLDRSNSRRSTPQFDACEYAGFPSEEPAFGHPARRDAGFCRYVASADIFPQRQIDKCADIGMLPRRHYNDSLSLAS
jgi:hypothetical protein